MKCVIDKAKISCCCWFFWGGGATTTASRNFFFTFYKYFIYNLKLNRITFVVVR